VSVYRASARPPDEPEYVLREPWYARAASYVSGLFETVARWFDDQGLLWLMLCALLSGVVALALALGRGAFSLTADQLCQGMRDRWSCVARGGHNGHVTYMCECDPTADR